MPTRSRSFEKASEALIASVLPIVLGRMRCAAQRLRAVTEELAADPRRREGRAVAELEEVQRQSDELGWLLGVLAAASGDGVPMTRREPFALAILVDLVAESVADEGRALEPDATVLPDLTLRSEGAWQVAWSLGLLFHAAAHGCPPGQALRWSLEREGERARLLFPGPHPEGVGELLADVAHRLPEARPRLAPDGFGLDLPGCWLSWPKGCEGGA